MGLAWRGPLDRSPQQSGQLERALIDLAKLSVPLAPMLVGVFRFVKLNKSLSTASEKSR